MNWRVLQTNTYNTDNNLPNSLLSGNCQHRQIILMEPSFPGGNSEWEPPDPIPNSEVKLLSANDSVRSPHAKVGHCQDFITNPIQVTGWGFLLSAT